MDLVEIRKKSKQKPSDKIVEKPVADPASETQHEATAVQPSEAKAGSKSEEKTTLPATQRPVVEQKHSELDMLDALFETTPDLTLATEEIYLQGLEGDDEDNDSDRQQWLTFNLGKEQYALDITYVREIIKPREITEIPRVPDFILGVVSLRGVIVPIYDLCRRLKLGSVEIDSRSRIIVCEQGDRVAGFLVDNISQVVRFSTGEIEPPPAILSGLDRELVEGVGRVQGKMIILLDLPSVLDVELK
jgi:purine-binding chemotaxis protein CheW